MTSWRPGLPSEPCVCDLAHDEQEQSFDEDTETWGDPRTVRIVWPLARVLAVVDGDLLVQHLIDHAPRGVLPRITRVTPGDGWEWRPIPVPEGV